MVSGKRKWIYIGVLVAALFISPGATPMGDFILFVALMTLFEVSIVIARLFEFNSGDGSRSKLEEWLATKTCSYCNAKVESDQTDFCPKCRRSIK